MPIEVRIAHFGNPVVGMTLEPGATVDALLTEAGIDKAGVSVFVNEERATLDTELKSGDEVMATSRIKGGC